MVEDCWSTNFIDNVFLRTVGILVRSTAASLLGHIISMQM